MYSTATGSLWDLFVQQYPSMQFFHLCDHWNQCTYTEKQATLCSVSHSQEVVVKQRNKEINQNKQCCWVQLFQITAH